MTPEVFQVALRRRLRLQLTLGRKRCPGQQCARSLDTWGDHLASCMRTGGVQRRAKPLERASQQAFREAGAMVVPQAFLRDMDLGVHASGNRRIDLVARGLPLFGGVPTCGDAALVSHVHADGTPLLGADVRDFVALERTRWQHSREYSELIAGDRGLLVVLGCEIGGRWAPEALELLHGLAAAKCEQAPALLRRSARLAWHRRWLGFLPVAVQRALAESLLAPTSHHFTEQSSTEPALGEVLAGVAEVPAGSRLPLR